jgi:D-methionine transport system ATP-binding protein
MIELSGVSKSFANHHALKAIQLFIPEGEIFGIIGRSGAGKSTLLRCINLLERPDQGKVLINQCNLMNLSSANLSKSRHQIGMIFQHYNLLHSKNVYDNIALPMRIQGISEVMIRERIIELLPLVELEDKVNVYPTQLSGGQKQRVAIARALACSPKILLCDEPTSALDPETTDAILDLLQKINQLYGITIVIITHEMEVIKKVCHRLALMEFGRISEITSIGQAFANKQSQARALLFSQLTPKLPLCLSTRLSEIPNDKPLIRLFFEGEEATVPFISQASRELSIDINILLANIDRFDTVTCGVLVAELSASSDLLKIFIQRCEQCALRVEILGYLHDNL